MPYSMVDKYQCFSGTCFLYLQAASFFKPQVPIYTPSHPRRTHIINYLKPVIHHNCNISRKYFTNGSSCNKTSQTQKSAKMEVQNLDPDQSNRGWYLWWSFLFLYSKFWWLPYHLRLFFKYLFNCYIIFISNTCYYISNTLCT